MFKKIISSAVLTILSLGLVIPTVLAESGLKLSPVMYKEEMDPGQEITRSIKITNLDDSEVGVNTSVRDFVAKDESGAQTYVEPTAGDDMSWSMVNWVTFDADQGVITLGPQETKEITFHIKVPEDASPGGHYGTLFFEPIGGGGEGQVGVSTRVGALLLIKVKGQIVEDAALASFEAPVETYTNDELIFVTRVENKGNVHLTPKGRIDLYDQRGRKLTQIADEIIKDDYGNVIAVNRVDFIPFNYEGLNILPQQTRRIETKWIRKPEHTGKFTAKMSMAYADGKESLQSELDMEVRKSVEVTTFSPENRFTGGGPMDWQVAIKNDGNVTLSTDGSIEIYSLFGKRKAGEPITFDLDMIGPQDIATGQVNIDTQGFGIYTARLLLGDGATTSGSSWFIIASLIQMILTLVVIVLIVLGLIAFIRRYRRMKKMLATLTQPQETLTTPVTEESPVIKEEIEQPEPSESSEVISEPSEEIKENLPDQSSDM